MNPDRAAPLEIAERKVREIGKDIDSSMPHGWGYILCLTEFGEGNRLAYYSNVSKSSVVDVSRELARRIEDGDERSLVIEHSDEQLSVSLDEALETLASIGKLLSMDGVSVEVDKESSGNVRDRIGVHLDKAIERAEALVLEHRPDLMADDSV